MGKIIYCTGGIRSGKSLFSEKYIYENDYNKKIYLATAIPSDDDMKSRIKKHKDRRDKSWYTIESYSNIIENIEPYVNEFDVILIDCISNMISNQMIFSYDIDWDNASQEDIKIVFNEILKELENLLLFLKKSKLDSVIVSSEVGMTLVSNFSLGRYFQDLLGLANQLIAKHADEAYLSVSGINIQIKEKK